jgi:hypothetical protein
MYHLVWKKYLPFINIQLKKSQSGEQAMTLNKIDFEKAGSGRKGGYKFTIEFTGTRVSNVISGCTLAMHLAAVMLENEPTRKILAGRNYEVSLNTKFQLTIKDCTPVKEVEETVDAAEQ